MPNKPLKLLQKGQSMTEYTIVLVFGVLALTTGPSGDVMQDLITVMKDNYSGYTYGLSLSEPPDFDTADEYEVALQAIGLEDEEIEKLTADTLDLTSDLKAYNKDPTAQLKKLEEIKSTMTSIPSSVGDVLGGAGSFF